jgi:hypothetical protein
MKTTLMLALGTGLLLTGCPDQKTSPTPESASASPATAETPANTDDKSGAAEEDDEKGW